ncbi:uncharacterized protein FA14DRAFT_160299 [Meira miltonrushii]|uniref:YTH domain-containing protein n=1 Tax=Meira miltonrushii TaxID=1280837 RepID=A0A316VBG1_9BASI|nr:uncharacterized protein FA14DRAFT_160299 [Meira miltonrushii]PWN34882.1 hypothetical protein FA14DRAFT_160299 [Meira miltonrushii]
MRPNNKAQNGRKHAASSSSTIDGGNEFIGTHYTPSPDNQTFATYPGMELHDAGSQLDMNAYTGIHQSQSPHPSNQYHSRSNYHYGNQARPPPSQNQQHYLPPNSYQPDPLSPSGIHGQYAQNVAGGEMGPYTTMSGMSGESQMQGGSIGPGISSNADLPSATVSPTDSVHDVAQDPYYAPYGAPGNTQVGPQFYSAATGPTYGQGQYQSNPYGMQYYPPYAQPPYYNPQRPPPGWIGAPSPQHQGWRPSPYYNYGGNLTVAPFHRTPNANRSRQQSSQGTHVGSRSASTSSRTSPNSNTPSRSGAPSGIPTPESSRSGSNRGVRAPSQSLQGQGPRSEYVLWCGNVPADATVDELYAFFSRLPNDNDEGNRKKTNTSGSSTPSADPQDPAVPAHGVLSIFIITRSSCAFINYATPLHLERALVFFQGQSLRPEDPRCPKLVCRVRKKDDEAQAGVAGQRGRGIHVAWLKEHERKAKEERQLYEENDTNAQHLVAPQAVRSKGGVALDREGVEHDATDVPSALTPTPQRANVSYSSQQRPSIDSSSGGSGSISLASTNSSLFRHPAFRERFFILKSLRVEDLDQSVKDGTWATQSHNEAVLDQAFRNSESVYLIFSANQSGGFYGYARMAGPINAPADRNATIRPDSIPEGDESGSDSQQKLALPPQTLTDVGSAYLSPLQLTPSSEGHDDALTIQNINSVSLDVPKRDTEKRGPQRSTISSTPSIKINERTDTISPTDFVAKPSAAPPVTVTAQTPDASTKGVGETLDPTLQVPDSTAAIVISPSTEEERELFSSELDPDRTNQRGNRTNPNRQTLSLGSTTSEPIRGSPKTIESNGDNSIGPNESASYPTDARSQSQLAIKALIHNLRLDEKESVHRAKQLEAVEAEMKAKDHSGHNSPDPEHSTAQTTIKPQPLASCPETWGKSFKVEWIKVHPISFSSVRRLRNPWRDDRQIKVSRDGTELEPNVGRQLLEEWTKAENEGNRTSKGASSNADDDEEEEDE